MDKTKAYNKNCFFYDENYDNYCRACSRAECMKSDKRPCANFKLKTDQRQIELDRQYHEQLRLLYYPNGVRK